MATHKHNPYQSQTHRTLEAQNFLNQSSSGKLPQAGGNQMMPSSNSPVYQNLNNFDLLSRNTPKSSFSPKMNGFATTKTQHANDKVRTYLKSIEAEVPTGMIAMQNRQKQAYQELKRESYVAPQAPHQLMGDMSPPRPKDFSYQKAKLDDSFGREKESSLFDKES